MHEPTFCSEWEAQTKALGLSLECGTMGDNMDQVRSQEHRRSFLPMRNLQFSEDVEVLCTNAAQRTCMLAHCTHGSVQQTLLRLEAQISLERAPLSFHEVKLAVSSSEEVEHDGSLMQTSLKPIQHNEIEAAPWNPQRYANGGYNDDEDSSSEHADDDDRDFDDDPNGPGDQPPDEPIVHPPASDGNRQSALLYHLDDIPVHTMLNWVDHETMMREVAHHFSRDRVDVLDCHDMTFQPEDVPEGTVPLIVQFARDIAVGAQSVLVLVDVIVHGQQQEQHYQTAPRVRRRVMPVLVMLLRQALLILTQLFEYCRFEHHRCLIKHDGVTWPLQDFLPRRIQHGNYLQIIVPPPHFCEVPTRNMIADSQNLEVDEFWGRYYVPTPPSVHNESAESETDVSPSLVDSEEIRQEFGNIDRDEEDPVDLMQRPHIDSNQAASSSDLAPALQQIMNESCVLNFSPDNRGRQPHWYKSLTNAFDGGAWIEDDDEGPVAFLTTWYADCSLESTSEDSRVVRLDTRLDLWVNIIQNRWRDRIVAGLPVHFAWVYPKPLEAPTISTLGHLIVFQNPNAFRAPILVNMQFKALRLDGTAHAVAVVKHGIQPAEFAVQLKLDRVCQGRRCTLHRGTPGKKWFDLFTYGEGIKMDIPLPGNELMMNCIGDLALLSWFSMPLLCMTCLPFRCSWKTNQFLSRRCMKSGYNLGSVRRQPLNAFLK